MENSTTPLPTGTADDEHVGLQIAFSLIAGASFAFNLLFCVMLLRNPALLKKPHNILLFSLAVVDMLTGNAHNLSSRSLICQQKYYQSLYCLY